MGRFLKILLFSIAGIAGILVVAAISLMIFFDPNDFRDRISAAVKEETGRDLVISGDISVSVFPWLAVDIGRTELGNAAGFGDEEFLSFEKASLSVRIVPLIIRQEITVGTASLDGLVVNLAVARNGTTNWQDLADGGDTSAPTQESDSSAAFDVASISVSDANVRYADAAAGTTYSISGLSFETGRIAVNTPIDIRAEFDFDATPGELGGHLAIRGTTTVTADATQISLEGLNVSGALRGLVAGATEFNFDSREIHIDTDAQSINPGEMDLTVLGMAMAANVEPFSYAGTPQPVADLRVATFSLKELLQKLAIEPPLTADANALERVSFSAKAALGENAISLSSMTLELDDSTMTGTLSLPITASGALGFDLEVDSIVLDGYMAPVDDSAAVAADESGDIEIPADLIRTLNAKGSFRIRQAYLAGMEFSNMELGVNSAGGKLRLNPLRAEFYEGSYAGDVRIDASGDVPSVSANESISDVNLGAMMKAMYDVDNITGTVNGKFVLGGKGQTLAAIQRDLDGNMSIALADGAWEGTDVWHQLRSARAMYRQEPVPEPTLPARTEFTAVTATGTVTDGIFRNEDFLAELPFLRLNGKGMVDLGTSEVDYAMEVRVFDRPEFMAGASAAEIADFTKTVVPIKITGQLSSPIVRPDIEGIFRGQVEEAIGEKTEELKNQLLNRLLGTDKPPATEDPDAAAEEPAEEDPQEKLKKDLLKKIFER
jgi:AsmA protein